jgi:hypothetical protein
MVRALGLRLRCLVFGLALASAAGAAEPVVKVTSRRLVLEQLLPSCPLELCSLDLGPAPPAGSATSIARDAVLRAVARVMANPPELALPESVRVVSEAKAVTPAELNEMVRPAVLRVLPVGVSLLRVESKTQLVIPATATFGAVELGKLPKRAGVVQTSALLEVVHEGSAVRRVPVLLQLSVSPGAARPDVLKGSDLLLVIERGSATISARGVALADAGIGEVTAFKIHTTGKVLRARVISSERALVTEGL